MAGSSITLPSRRTGTPNNGSSALAAWMPESCSGSVYLIEIIAGIGDRKEQNQKDEAQLF